MPKVCFVPIWYPLESYATSRLRAKYVVELLAGHDRWDVRLDYQLDADIAVMVQLCSDRNLRRILDNRHQVVVYDICDRFFETDSLFNTEEGSLSARKRCLELIERADVLIAPTRRLKGEIAERFPGKPCFYVPELVDYGGTPQPTSGVGSRRLLWFGNTTRGNFESAQWMMEHLRSRYGYRPVLVTSPRRIALDYPAYTEFLTAWSPEALRRELAKAELCIVSHAAEERSKSPNRFVTAIMHGVPTLVGGSPACIDILRAAGHGEFAIETPQDIDRAIAMLSNPDERVEYVTSLQKEMWRRHGPETVRSAYLRLFRDIWPVLRHPRRVFNVGLVTSLSSSPQMKPFPADLARGLEAFDFNLHVFAVEDGPLRAYYEERRIGVVAAAGVSQKPEGHFARFLADKRIDVVICDGVATARYCRWSRNEGRKTALLLGATDRYARPPAALDEHGTAVDDVGLADVVVFTSEAGRLAWQDRGSSDSRTIEIGLATERFAQAAQLNRRDARSRLGLPNEPAVGLWIDAPAVDRSAAIRCITEPCSNYPLAARLLAVRRSAAGLVSDRVYGPGLGRDGQATNPTGEPLDGLYLRAADFLVTHGQSAAAPLDCAAAMYFGLPILFLKADACDASIQHGKQGFVATDEDSALRYFLLLSADAKRRAQLAAESARSFWEGPTYCEMLKSYRSLLVRLAVR